MADNIIQFESDGAFTQGETFNKTVEHLESCGYFVNTKLSAPTDITFTAR